ncbi:MAG: N-6 DNA methylase [Schwartzia sp.]|nr:N-6 DNA methylase [Schwartzia sp. (in: firmicutes)]
MSPLEHAYYSSTDMRHIKSYGQFYTLDKVADFMTDWILQDNASCIYDPAFGMGAFYFSSKSNGFEGKFIANEYDVNSYNFFVKNCIFDDLTLRNVDYFSQWGQTEKYDAIICNPPYLRFQNISNRHEIISNLSAMIREKLSGYTNMASAFLIKSIFELNEGGRLAYIMPSEFLNAGYGKQIKEYMLKHGSIENIIQINDEKGAFDSVITTVCIIFFIKNKKSSSVCFSKIKSIENMDYEKCSSIQISDLKVNEKWQIHFENIEMSPRKGFVPLSYYGKFKRGIATGVNEFFALTKQEIDELGLLDTEYLPCIIKSNQIKGAFFERDVLNDIIQKDEKAFILNLPKNREKLSKGANAYVQYGESCGYDERYLTRHRMPWFSIEKRTPSPLLFGVFSRDRFKIIRNRTNAVNLTCYHGFQFHKPSFNCVIDKLFVYLKSNLAKEMINQHKRIYGKNLTKFEPNDLSNILVPSFSLFQAMDENFLQTQLAHIAKYDCLDADGDALINRL